MTKKKKDREKLVLGELSPEAKAARMPLPPAMLVDALQDRVHELSGRLITARAVRTVRVIRAADRTPEQVEHLHDVGAREIKRHAGLMKRLAKCDIEQYIKERGLEHLVQEATERQLKKRESRLDELTQPYQGLGEYDEIRDNV